MKVVLVGEHDHVREGDRKPIKNGPQQQVEQHAAERVALSRAALGRHAGASGSAERSRSAEGWPYSMRTMGTSGGQSRKHSASMGSRAAVLKALLMSSCSTTEPGRAAALTPAKRLSRPQVDMPNWNGPTASSMSSRWWVTSMLAATRERVEPMASGRNFGSAAVEPGLGRPSRQAADSVPMTEGGTRPSWTRRIRSSTRAAAAGWVTSTQCRRSAVMPSGPGALSAAARRKARSNM